MGSVEDGQFKTFKQQQHEDVVEKLFQRFSEIVSRDVISDIVQHCNGDLLASTNAMLDIIGDEHESPTNLPPTNAPPSNEVSSNTNPPVTAPIQTNQAINDPAAVPPATTSFANIASVRPRPIIKNPKSPRRMVPDNVTNYKHIVKYHNLGYCTLILMRGAPGCGKTTLAREIVAATVGAGEQNYRNHIASTDDYFCFGGTYSYDRTKITHAHTWNERRVNDMLRQGLSPVIVDNTNIKLWEMEKYVKSGVQQGYIIELVDVKTLWARKPFLCAQKCVHHVPIDNIKRMIENYECPKVTGEKFLEFFNITYAPNKRPPIRRSHPPVIERLATPFSQPSSTQINLINQGKILNGVGETEHTSNISTQSTETSTAFTTDPRLTTKVEANSDSILLRNIEQRLINEQYLDEINAINQAWDYGDSWTEGNKLANETSPSIGPKPPRQSSSSQLLLANTSQLSSLNSLPTLNEMTDWSQACNFWSSCNGQAPSTSNESTPKNPVETSTVCIGTRDTNIFKERYTVLIGTPRDINLYHRPMPEKIPDKRMLDKSSMTNEQIVMSPQRCSNEHKHFKAFRSMFKDIAKADLWDIFDKCQGDVNWAAEIVLGGVKNLTIEKQGEDIESDEDELFQEPCSCAGATDCIPDAKKNVKVEAATFETPQLLMPKKVKKDKVVSENSLQLKRQIEKNISLANNHYSPHVLKIKNLRQGVAVPSTSSQNVIESESTEFKNDSRPSTSNEPERESEECSVINREDLYEEETTNVYVGFDFINQLDTAFDREGLSYTENIVPTICMPRSILRIMNALWIESLTNQIEGQAELANAMIKEDEDFARELADKEDELERTGAQPPILDIKEIMDMEKALSNYRKYMVRQKNQELPTLADILSRNKLYAMFPAISKDSLTEMLLAHDNNFKKTVEVVLMSLGMTDVLVNDASLNKFIAQKELEEHYKRLEIEKQKQIDYEADFPSLKYPELGEVEISLESVKHYRSIGESILKDRLANIEKARNYMRRGMTEAASYYCTLSTMQTARSQQVNGIAASVLVQLNKKNEKDEMTVDLHMLRVAEALQTLDIFIDQHLRKLWEDKRKGENGHVVLCIITGRGLHSKGGPKIRPAVQRRLMQRGFSVTMQNPGVCSITLTGADKMTHQL